MPLARIIIVNFNAGENLSHCMAALRAQTEADFEVRVVDNASTDGSLRYIPDDDSRFTVAHAGGNIGFAAGCNLGATNCVAPFVIFLNPDAFPEPDWLQALLHAAREYPDFAMFGSLQISAEDSKLIDGAGDCYSCFGFPWRAGYNQPLRPLPAYTDAFSPCAAAAMYRTEWFDRVGGFDEAFFCYLEDVDLAFRVRLFGGRGLQVNLAIVRHVGGASAGTDSDFSNYYSARNRLRTIVKNAPGWLLVVMLPLHLAASVWVFFRSKRRRAITSGIRDGIVGIRSVWKQRTKIQAAKVASAFEIAHAINWSPLALYNKKIPTRRW